MNSTLTIKEWAEDDRPRERLAEHGPSVLSEAELLAILIGSGNTEESAVELMKRILADCDGSLRNLGRKSIAELTAYKGMGPAKAISILAACELGKRRAREQAEEKRFLSNALEVYQLMHPRMQDLPHEECYALYLRQDGSLQGKPHLISRGGIAGTAVDIRLVLREALLRQTSMLILVHNHPSGNLRPSREDDELTNRLNRSSTIMGLHLRDHVIVTDGDYYSYREQGKL